MLLFSTSLWACGYCVLFFDELIMRRLLGCYMCGGINSTFFFIGKTEFLKRKKWPFHHVLSTSGQLTRLFSVSQFWSVGAMFLKTKKTIRGTQFWWR